MSVSKEQIESGLKKVVYLILIAGAAFLFNIARTYIFESDQFFYIQVFDIAGIESLTDRDVVTLSGLNVGEKLGDDQIQQAKENIKRSPYVKSVVVQPQLPSTVQIFIEEYKPVAYLRTKELKLISQDGRVLPRPVERDYQDLPVILLRSDTLISDGVVLRKKTLDKALHIVNVMNNVSVDLARIISEIECLENELKIRLIEGGSELLLDLNNLESQLLTFDFFIKKKRSIDFIRNLSYIDLRFKDRVVTKKRG